MLADLGIELGGGEQRVTRWQLAAARPESLVALERLGADPESARAVERMREQIVAFRGLPPVPAPAGFVGTLRPYQQQGLDFLAWTGSLGFGAVLAVTIWGSARRSRRWPGSSTCASRIPSARPA